MRTLRRLGVPKLLKVALLIITLSGVALFLSVHQLEKPSIQELEFPKNYHIDEGREKDHTLNSFQDKDSFFDNLLTPQTNSLRLDETPSQSIVKENSNNWRRVRKNFPKLKGTSKYEKTKEAHPDTNLSVRETVDTSSVETKRGTTRFSRGVSDDSRQSRGAPSDSRKLEYSTESSQRFSEGANEINVVSLDSKKNGNPQRKTNDSAKAGTESEEAKNRTFDAFNKTKPPLKQNPRKVVLIKHSEVQPKVTIDRRDSDKLPTISPERLKHRRQRKQGEKILNKQGYTKPLTNDKFRTSDEVPDTSPEKTKIMHQSLSSEVHSRIKDSNTSDLTNDPTNSDKLPKKSPRTIMKTSDEKHGRKTVSYNQTRTQTSTMDGIRETKKHPKTSRELDGHPKSPSGKRKSLLIFGDDRSGTTFVTKMFAADPQMFTIYEPLWVTKRWFTEYGITRSIVQERVVLDVVNALLSCKFTRSDVGEAFLGYTRVNWAGGGVFEKNIFRTSAFLRKTRKGMPYFPSLADHPEFAEAVCLKKFNHSVVKVGQVRVPDESIAVFLPRIFRENPDTDIRVIQIVRDPRGSINSRIRNGWISDFTYTGFPRTVKGICDKIVKNVQFTRGIQAEWTKDRYLEITYQEIATRPISTAKKIYKFAGFEMPDSLIGWIAESTNPDQDQLDEALNNPFSHIRDSSNNHLKWRKESPIKRVRVIEENCLELLGLLGLNPVADEMETICG